MTLVVAKWTLEEYHRMIDAGILDERHVELLNGEIVEMSPEGTLHAHLSSEAADYVRELLGKRVKVREGKPITLPNHSEPEPDVVIVQPLGDVYLEHHPYPENIFWLIEFSNSGLEKDIEVKRKLYANANISEYWIVNLRKRELLVFRSPDKGDYQTSSTLTGGKIAPLAFPDVSFSVGRLLKK